MREVARRADRERPHAVRSVAAGVAAGAALWCALLLTGAPRPFPASLARIPLEGLVFAALVLVLPPRWRRAAAVGLGAVLGLLVVWTALDAGFGHYLDRPFDPLTDWASLGPAVGVLADTRGWLVAAGVSIAAVLATLAVLVLLPAAALRVTAVVSRHRTATAAAVGAGLAAWALVAVTGLQVAPGVPVASVDAATAVSDDVRRVRADLADRRRFAEILAVDRFDDVPGDRLLTALRGKDVVVVFVESYGRVAVEGSDATSGLGAVLDDGTRRLRAAGFTARSAWLRSPTFGGVSWLAHATLQSGVWVDGTRRYDDLLRSDRLTLTRAFGRAGWRTVVDTPQGAWDWPEGTAFYGVDAHYDARNVRYRGPSFGYAAMPDQYALDALRRLELARADRGPVMAEIDLVSSHTPWTPLPPTVPWDELGDGSVFRDLAPVDVPGSEAERYGTAVAYSLRTVVSFVETSPDPDLVLVVLGDHQPHHPVAADDAAPDVPVTLLAQDPAVLDRIAGWGWTGGMRPSPDAPVWPMDAFRDRFLTAFGPSGDGTVDP